MRLNYVFHRHIPMYQPLLHEKGSPLCSRIYISLKTESYLPAFPTNTPQLIEHSDKKKMFQKPMTMFVNIFHWNISQVTEIHINLVHIHQSRNQFIFVLLSEQANTNIQTISLLCSFFSSLKLFILVS